MNPSEKSFRSFILGLLATPMFHIGTGITAGLLQGYLSGVSVPSAGGPQGQEASLGCSR
jgi:hypothetical protein